MCICMTDAAAGRNADAREVLPTNVRPTHYELTISPDLESFVFSGTVAISLDVHEQTTTITANANELTFLSARIVVIHIKTETTQSAKSISTNPSAETVTFEFESPIPVGSKVILHVEFTGIHNKKMAGFYRSGYTDKLSGMKKHLVVTQFEATDARRAFPCWDEPNIKATFDSTLIVESHLTALSNTNAIEERQVVVKNKTVKAIKFARTPIMSTYLVAFAVGEFDFVGTQARPRAPLTACPIDVRVYTLRGESDSGRFALNVAARTLEYFSEYFDISYPLPKMDMIAIPDFSAGAMENWGLVTYRQTALLVDEHTSAIMKQRVAYVVGHELAHQWFGNLVTMDWWSELWLNEGFATFVGWLATDNLFPEWQIWRNFVNEEFGSGLRLDGLRSSHPIEVEVKSPSEINQIFDAISYSKGASVIRMLSNFLGNDVFANGVRKYLKKFSFSNAKTEDLWAALSEVSNVDVSGMMYTWTRETGYPVVKIVEEVYDEERQEMTLTIRQARFLSSGKLSAEEEANGAVWEIPLTVVTHVNPHSPTRHVVKEREAKVKFPYSQTAGHFWKLNYQSTGFYRVCLSAEQQTAIGRALKGNLERVTVEDRMELISSAFAIAKAGVGSTSGALTLAKSFEEEEDYFVLNAIAGALSELQAISYEHSEVVCGIERVILSIFSGKAAKMGFEVEEDHLIRLKRNLVISMAAKAGDVEVVEALKKMFLRYVSGEEEVPADLRLTCFTTANRASEDARVFEQLRKIYETEGNAEVRIDALRSFGASRDAGVVAGALAAALEEETVRGQDVMYVLRSVRESPAVAMANGQLWDFLRQNWDGLCERLSASLSLLGHCVGACVGGTVSVEFAAQVSEWAAGKECADEGLRQKRVLQMRSVQRPLEQTVERMISNAEWIAREKEEVEKWMKEN